MLLRYFKGLTLCFAMLSTAGCLNVVSVNQPDSASAGQSFIVTMDVIVGDQASTNVFNSGYPIFGAMLPDGWEVLSCSYSGDFSGICSESTATAFEGYSNAPVGYSWHQYDGETEDFTGLINEDLINREATVTWTIRPTSSGEFSINYAAGGVGIVPLDPPSTNTGVENNNSAPGAGFNQPISVAANGTIEAVPALSAVNLVLLTALLGFLGWRTQRRRAAKKG